MSVPPPPPRLLAAAARSQAQDMALRVAARPAADGTVEFGMGFDDWREHDETTECHVPRACCWARSSRDPCWPTLLDYVEVEPGRHDFVFVLRGLPNARQRHPPPRACGSGGCNRCGLTACSETCTRHECLRRLARRDGRPVHAATAPCTWWAPVPGDPDLLTLRAARLLQQADVVVYDHLVGDGRDGLVGPQAERLYVGKQRDRHSLAAGRHQRAAGPAGRLGPRVVRLKGGDPFVFGRGGEELQVLAEAGVPFQVVPGITAACGVASYAGIPLTHRDHAQSCTFVTGHLKDGSCDLDWAALARPRQTVVIYMGLSGLDEICRQLVAHGLSPDWPAAVVSRRHAGRASRWCAPRCPRWPRGGARRAAITLPDHRRRGGAPAPTLDWFHAPRKARPAERSQSRLRLWAGE
jgi:uroporphyrin-III C-methyltransferase/precorrin-2 dehydrogenase/sirohydrochlorin ferrochelatase